MLDVISSLERDKLGERLQRCLVYSIQIDGSMDRTQRDNKFVTARLMTTDGRLETAFLNVMERESAGAEGLLEAVKSSLTEVGKCSTREADWSNYRRRIGQHWPEIWPLGAPKRLSEKRHPYDVVRLSQV